MSFVFVSKVTSVADQLNSSKFQSLLTNVSCNDLTIGWQNSNPLSHPNATLAPQARQARASGKNLNYVTLLAES